MSRQSTALQVRPIADAACLWIVSPADPSGDLRIVTTCAPEHWPKELIRAAAITAVVDQWHRAGRDAEAQEAAEELELALRSLARRGVEAWLEN